MSAEMDGQVSIFDLDGWSGKMLSEHSVPTKAKISKPSSRKSSESQNPMPLMCLCLKKESGPTPGNCTMKWVDGQLRGEPTMLNSGEYPNGGKEYLWSPISVGGAQRKSCLSNILETNPNPKYNLSPKACQGILTRARRRGKTLPPRLEQALIIQSGGAISFQERAGKEGGGKGILIQNERTGALSTLNNQSVFGIPSFNSNAMKSSNPTSGYKEEETASTLDNNGGSPDCYQGGTAIVYRKQGHPQNAEQPQKWEESETADTLNVSDNSDARTPILINQEVYENHTQDSRYKPLGEVCSTLATNLGTGGNNQPLVVNADITPKIDESGVAFSLRSRDYKDPQCVNSSGEDVSGTLDANYYKGCGERQNVEREVVCVGNGQMCNITMKPVANTLDTMHDAQAVISYGVDCYNQEEEEVTMTVQAKGDNEHIPCAYSLDRAYFNQGKNAQYNPSIQKETTQTIVSKGPNAVAVGIVRRLTPMECERLQGFPDNWTNIGEWVDSKGKKHKEADAPRYKALGNSIAIPYWFWLLRRISATYTRRATLGSLFDGIGGFPYAWEMCNGRGSARWASEIEEFPIAVTKKHFPESEE